MSKIVLRDSNNNLTYQNINHFKVPAGTIVLWATSIPPEGWVFCDGKSDISQTDLSLRLGNAQVAPDFRGRTVVSTTDDRNLGKIEGNENIKMNTVPKHNHSLTYRSEYSTDNNTGLYSNRFFKPLPEQAYWLDNESKLLRYKKVDRDDSDGTRTIWIGYSENTMKTIFGNNSNKKITLPSKTETNGKHKSFSVIQPSIVLNYIIKLNDE